VTCARTTFKPASARGINFSADYTHVVGTPAIVHNSGVDIGLSDFVTQLAAEIDLEGTVDFPLESDLPWHLLFYKLKKEDEFPGEKPSFFGEMFFDWDGPFPKSRNLEECLQTLHSTSTITANNPVFTTFRLKQRLAKIWRQEVESAPLSYQEYMRHAKDLAVGTLVPSFGTLR